MELPADQLGIFLQHVLGVPPDLRLHNRPVHEAREEQDAKDGEQEYAQRDQVGPIRRPALHPPPLT